MNDEKWIAIDFDGTMVIDAFPSIGADNPMAVDVVKRLHKDGIKIVLNTCRQGERLKEAVDWMLSRGIILDGINENPHAAKKWGGTDCKKVYADIYIDDHNAFVKKNKHGAVDWKFINRNYNRLLG